MKLGLLGYGKMGQEVAKVAAARGHDVVAIVCSGHEAAHSKELALERLSAADVCIDFTHPHAVVENMRALTQLGMSMVVGTTGWDTALPQRRQGVLDAGIGCVYGSNFSLGVQLFFLLAQRAAELLNPFEGYDVAVHEVHHQYKADSPSGTALDLAKKLLEGVTRKKSLVTGPSEGAPKPTELSISSLRCGEVPGTHSAIFDSACDTITLTHTARNRHGFAEGAVHAAEWIAGRQGFYSVSDMVERLIAS